MIISWVSVDVESDGQVPGLYSMVAVGACLVTDPSVGFLGYLSPISSRYDPEALAVSGFTREQTETFPDPAETMQDFYTWILANANQPYIFVSDNNGFDFAFVNYYFHAFMGKNPFGWSSRRIGDLFCGARGDTRAQWKHLRKTPHDHNPLHDAQGNAEALQIIIDKYNIKAKL